MGQELHTSSSAESSSAGLTCYQIFITEEFVQEGEERRERKERKERKKERRCEERRREERRLGWDGAISYSRCHCCFDALSSESSHRCGLSSSRSLGNSCVWGCQSAEWCGPDGSVVLIRAVRSGLDRVVLELLRAGVPVNNTDHTGSYLLPVQTV